MKTKTYTIEVSEDENKFTLRRRNDGFTAYELIGLIEHLRDDLMHQLRKETNDNIDVIKREVVKD